MIANHVFAALAPLVPDERVYPHVAPLDTPRPYIEFFQVGGKVQSFIDKAMPSKRNARIQVEVTADDGDQATALIYAVEDALVQLTTMQVEALGAHINRDEPELNLFGRQQDFSCWADR